MKQPLSRRSLDDGTVGTNLSTNKNWACYRRPTRHSFCAVFAELPSSEHKWIAQKSAFSCQLNLLTNWYTWLYFLNSKQTLNIK